MVTEKAEVLAEESIRRLEERIRRGIDDGSIELHVPPFVCEMFEEHVVHVIANSIIGMVAKLN